MKLLIKLYYSTRSANGSTNTAETSYTFNDIHITSSGEN